MIDETAEDFLARSLANEAEEDFYRPHVVMSYLTDHVEGEKPVDVVAAVAGPFPDFPTAARYADTWLAELNEAGDGEAFGVALRVLYEPDLDGWR